MGNPRKHASEGDFVPDPKRRMQAKNTGGKTRLAPIDVDETATQRQKNATPNKTQQKKGTPVIMQKNQTPRPGGAPQQAQQATHRRREDSAKPGDDDVTETPAPVEPPKPPRPYEVIQPFPTHVQFLRDDFPVYADADTLIVLDPDHQYFLHSATLKRPIPFFKEDELRKVLFKEIHRPGVQLPIWEKKEKMDFTRMKKYLLEVEESGEGYILKRVPFTCWKEIPKPPVVEDNDAPNKEAAAGPTPDAAKAPGAEDGNGIDGQMEPARAEPNVSAIQSVAQAGPAMNGPNNTTTAAQQASAPPSTQASQTTPVPSSSQASSATTTTAASQNPTAARATGRPAQKMKLMKGEDGIKVEVMEDDDRSGFTPSVRPRLGIDLTSLPELDGRRVLEMHGETHYVEEVDPADPQQLTAQNTINLGGLVYRLTPVNPVAPAALAAVPDEPAQVDRHDEEEIAEPLPPSPCPSLMLQDIIFGFSALFAIIYNQPSLISTSNINTALLQCESLIAAAESLSALRVVTANIGNSIMNFGKVVYLAILDNPRRWLKLAVEIGHGAIFQEAVVHVVGCWPDVVSESYFSMLNKTTIDLLEKKATELRLKCYEVNEKLFAASLDVGSSPRTMGRAELDKDNTQRFDAWFIVQLWRNWYSDQLAMARISCTPELLKKKPCSFPTLYMMGALFRFLDAGGDAYLAKADVEKLLQAYRERKPKSQAGMNGFLQFYGWEEDLNRMKEFAKGVVGELMVNHSMLAPKEHGLHYFTCTLVPEGERPWDVEVKQEK